MCANHEGQYQRDGTIYTLSISSIACWIVDVHMLHVSFHCRHNT